MKIDKLYIIKPKIVKITPDSLILSNGDLTSSTGGSKYHLWK